MFWKNPVKPITESSKPATYVITTESVFYVPGYVRANVFKFEESLDNHIRTKIDEFALIAEMAGIVRLYNEHGGVRIHSEESHILRDKHSSIVIKFLKENLTHVNDFIKYTKLL